MDFKGYKMTNHVQILNIEKHKNLKKVVSNDFTHVRSEQIVPVNIQEFPAASVCFPLFFIKDRKTANLFPIALFGLTKNTNSYYSLNGWLASYVPLNIRLWPFSMMLTEQNTDKKQWQVAADMRSEILSDTVGDSLFNEGKPSDLLNDITNGLISDSKQKLATAQFIDFLMLHDLIKPIKFELGFVSKDKQQVDGIYAIDEDVLKDIQPEQVQEMHQKDYFKAIYCMLASQHNLYDLIKRSQVEGSNKSVTSLDLINA